MRVSSLGLVLLVAVAAGTAGAADRFVSTLGSDAANDCLTSSAPCLTIGHALAAASSGDTVKVATGRYDESLDIAGSIVVALSGSWTPDFATRDAARRSSRLVSPLQLEAASGMVIDVTVDGFLLTNRSGVQAQSSGNGVLTLRLASTGLDFNRFVPGISAFAYDTSTLAIDATDTSVSSNMPEAASGGAGIYLVGYEGTAITFTMTDSAVEKNFGATYGTAGIRVAARGTLEMVLTRTRLARNRGHGLVFHDVGTGSVDVALTESTVERNRSSGVVWTRANVSITNSVIARNRSVALGMDVVDAPSTLEVVNSTIRGNRLGCGQNASCTAGIWVTGALGTVDLRNAIVWGNRAPGGVADVSIASGATVNVDHSDIGELTGVYTDLGGNISADPLFVSGRDAHLTVASPAINTGTCTGAPATDFEGDPRPTGAGCDMGADEYVP